ncbi:hypothetical protein Hanom_Chr15g01344531 [Helianthus anomalus]
MLLNRSNPNRTVRNPNSVTPNSYRSQPLTTKQLKIKNNESKLPKRKSDRRIRRWCGGRGAEIFCF